MAVDVENSYTDHDYGLSFIRAVLMSENGSYEDEEYFLSYSLPHNIRPTVDMMALLTSPLLVIGFFTNIITIGMLSAEIFDRMSFAVLMKILCMYNIVVLFLGTVRYNSFYLDYHTQISEPDRRYFCTYLLWFVLVFRHARTASVMLILYNRIKALSHPDCFHKYVDAIRLPILGNSLFLLVSTVPVSRYISTLDDSTEKYNRTECTFAHMFPYKRDRGLSADEMVSNLPVFEHGTTVFMLIVFFIKLIRKERRRHTTDTSADSTTSSPPLLKNPPMADVEKLSAWKLRNHYSLGKFSALPTQGVMEINEILFPVAACHVEVRDSAVTVMAVTIIIINMFTSGLREAVDSFMVMDIFPITTTDIMAFKIRSFLDLSFFTFMATMFFIMCLTCTSFRKSSFNLLFSVNLDEVHSESSFAYSFDNRVNEPSIETTPLTDAKEASPSEQKTVDTPSIQGGNENPLITRSVCSLEKKLLPESDTVTRCE